MERTPKKLYLKGVLKMDEELMEMDFDETEDYDLVDDEVINSSGKGKWVILAAVGAAIGGGALLYNKVIKPRRAKKKSQKYQKVDVVETTATEVEQDYETLDDED